MWVLHSCFKFKKMKNSIIIFALILSKVSLAQSPNYLFHSKLKAESNNQGNLILHKKIGSSSFGIYDQAKNKLVNGKKLGKEFKAHSNILSIGNKWVYVHDAEKGKFANGDYSLIELNNYGNFSYSAPFFECQEKLGSLKFYGLAATSSQVAFVNRLKKSTNENYILSVASKFFGSKLLIESLNVSLEDYRKSNEVVQFALANSKLEVVKKGSFDAGVTRRYIKDFQFHVSDLGDIYFVYILNQEFVEESNRVLIVKVSSDGNSVEKINVNMPKFNSSNVKINFTKNKIELLGVANLFSLNEVEEPKVKGLIYGCIDLKTFSTKDLNIMIFSEEQKKKLNDIYKKNEKVLLERENYLEVFPQFDTRFVSYGEDKVGYLLRYDVPLKTESTALTPGSIVGHSYSSYFFVRISENKNRILDITPLENMKGENDRNLEVIQNGGDDYFIYSLGDKCVGLKIPSDGVSSFDETKQLCDLRSADQVFRFSGLGGIQINNSNDYYFNVRYIKKINKLGVARFNLNF